MTEDRKCFICNKVLHSINTMVVGELDFCREHGGIAIVVVNDAVKVWAYQYKSHLDNANNPTIRSMGYISNAPEEIRND